MCLGKCMYMYDKTHFTAVDYAKQASQIVYVENNTYVQIRIYIHTHTYTWVDVCAYIYTHTWQPSTMPNDQLRLNT